MSNSDRLSRLREEAEIKQSERSAKDRAERNAGRLRAVWAIKDGAGNVVVTFAYPRRADAEREAQRLKEANRATYIVCPHKIPFDG